MQHLLLLASENPHKLRELRELLTQQAARDASWRVCTLRELGLSPPSVLEDGASFEDNARKKAAAVAELAQTLSLADDSGLEVDALDGRPGVRSARFAHEHASCAENNAALLAALQPHIAQARARGEQPMLRARFRCVLCLYDPSMPSEARAQFVHGRCEGRLLLAPRGAGGFGYDPLFVADDGPADRSFAELSAEQKHALSHRGRAMTQLLPLLAAKLHALAARRSEQP